MTSKTNKVVLRQLGRNGPNVSSIGFGSMGVGAFYGGTDENAAMETLTYAADRGMTFWDTADIYGTSEATIGKWFNQTGRRSDIFLATKFGAFDPTGKPQDGVISHPTYVKMAFECSLAQLKTDHVDLYYQHRVDARVPIEIVLEALREFVEKGQIKWLGLSECSIKTLKRAKAVEDLGDKIIAVQMEYSPMTLDIEKNGFAEAADQLGVSVVCYSPLARGLVSGRFRSRSDFEEGDLRLVLPRWSEENFPRNLKVVDKLKDIADKYHSTPVAVTLAWILASHPTWIPIPGCRTAERVEENAAASDLELSDTAIAEVRMLTEEAEVAGTRNRTLAWISSTVEGNCIPLHEWKNVTLEEFLKKP